MADVTDSIPMESVYSNKLSGYPITPSDYPNAQSIYTDANGVYLDTGAQGAQYWG